MPTTLRPPPTPAVRRCWAVVDAGLIVALPLAALCFGGRHDLGRLVYIAGVAIATLAWLSARLYGDRRVRPTRAYAVLVAAVAMIALQLFALPEAFLDGVAPDRGEWLSLGTGENTAQSPQGVWSCVSVAPGETRLSLALLIAHSALFVVVLQRFQTLEQVLKFGKALALMAAGMAVLGIAQWLLPNGRMLWLYDHPFRDFGEFVQGPFINRNHFAHYVVLGTPALMVLAAKSWRACGKSSSVRNRRRGVTGDDPDRRAALLAAWVWSSMLVVALAAVLLAQSRGGMLALSVALVVTVALMWRHGVIGRTIGPRTIATVATVGGALLVVGQLLLAQTLQLAASLREGSFVEETGRQAIWSANRDAFLANPWLGWGAGSHRFFYQLFFDAPVKTVYTHAESGYLQVASEAGAIGLTGLLAAIVLVVSWSWRSVKSENPAVGELACVFIPPLFASLTHAVVDFVWYVPACMALTVTAAAAAARLAQQEVHAVAGHHLDTPWPWWRAWTCPSAMSLGVVVATCAYIGPAVASLEWDRYLKTSRVMSEYSRTEVQATPEDRERHRLLLKQYVGSMLARLNSVARWRPDHPEAQRQLCARKRQMFELTAEPGQSALPAIQIRDAALASGFASLGETRRWMHSAFGDRAELLVEAHQHAVRTTQIIPLVGESYLALAELSFLSQPLQRDHVALIEHAVTLRPNDGRVLFEAGRLIQAEGRHDRAVELWRRSCQYPGSHWQALAGLMCGNGVPAKVFLERIQPPWRVFIVAANLYAHLGSDQDRRAMAEYGTCVSGEPDETRTDFAASRLWLSVSELHRAINDLPAAIHAAQQADYLAPDTFKIRYQLADLQMKAGRPGEAEPHLRWCLARRPDLTRLRVALADTRRRAASAPRTNVTGTAPNSSAAPIAPFDGAHSP